MFAKTFVLSVQTCLCKQEHIASQDDLYSTLICVSLALGSLSARDRIVPLVLGLLTDGHFCPATPPLDAHIFNRKEEPHINTAFLLYIHV